MAKQQGFDSGIPGFRVYELTMAQYRELLKDQAARSAAAMKRATEQIRAIREGAELHPNEADSDPVNYLADDITTEELEVICRCSAEDLDQLTASELMTLIDAAKSANEFFFAKRAKQESSDSNSEFLRENPDLLKSLING